MQSSWKGSRWLSRSHYAQKLAGPRRTSAWCVNIAGFRRYGRTSWIMRTVTYHACQPFRMLNKYHFDQTCFPIDHGRIFTPTSKGRLEDHFTSTYNRIQPFIIYKFQETVTETWLNFQRALINHKLSSLVQINGSLLYHQNIGRNGKLFFTTSNVFFPAEGPKQSKR